MYPMNYFNFEWLLLRNSFNIFQCSKLAIISLLTNHDLAYQPSYVTLLLLLRIFYGYTVKLKRRFTLFSILCSSGDNKGGFQHRTYFYHMSPKPIWNSTYWCKGAKLVFDFHYTLWKETPIISHFHHHSYIYSNYKIEIVVEFF